MFNNLKRGCLALSLTTLSLLCSIPSYASTTTKKKSISYIEVNIDGNIAEGMEYGSESIEVETKTNHVELVGFYISDYNIKENTSKKTSSSPSDDDDDDDDDDEDTDDTDDTTSIYDYGSDGATRPTGVWTNTPPTLAIVFKVSDKDKYKFSIKNSTGFDITGTAAAKYKSVSSGSEKIILYADLETVKSGTDKLNGTYVTEDGETIVFPYSEDNTYFTIRLYKDSKIYGTAQTEIGEDQFDLSSMIYDAGTYKVQVRSYDKSTHQQSAWVTLKDSVKYTASDVRLSQKNLGTTLIKQNADGTGTVLKNTETAPTGGNIHLAPTDEGSFEDHTTVWKWKEKDGTYAKACWHRYDGNWYYFNLSGEMVKGWQKINDKWYYFDTTYGYAKSGWRYIDGFWYYFSDEDQSMLTNTTTPDGYYVGATGAWVIQ